MISSVDWSKVASAWSVLETELGPIDLSFTATNADRIATLVDSLLEATSGEDPATPLLRLLDVLSDWISEYERAHVETSHASPTETLRHLMESNGLRQKDLAPLLGGQSVVSDVLSGKRAINARQALALGARFKISPLAFMSAAADAAPVHHVYFAQETGPEAKAYPAFSQLGYERGVEAMSIDDSSMIYVSTE